MKIIPAIDIMDRRVVRLEQGRFDKDKVYSENPILIAKKWKECGADLLHVVDLDGARLGKPINLDVVEEMIKGSGVDIELGGGLRKETEIEAALKAGIKFVVLGTSAVRDAEFSKAMIGKFGEKIIFAVDVKDKRVAIEGWEEVSQKSAEEYVKELESCGAKRIIYTDISRDGMMSGPNLESLKEILSSTTLEVTASGGVSSIEHIKVLKGMEGEGLTGVIIGRALYEGKIDLKEALNVG